RRRKAHQLARHGRPAHHDQQHHPVPRAGRGRHGRSGSCGRLLQVLPGARCRALRRRGWRHAAESLGCVGGLGREG
ncbi:hypothetical protein BN1708_020483, partial [Verticillium longisporum]